MKTSESISDLCAALAKAQADFKNVARDKEVTVKTKTGGSYKFAYAPFESIVDAIRTPLGSNGLSFIQSASNVDGQLTLLTRLMHASGQWIETATPIVVSENGAQALGSGITYSKRYALTALLGIAADEDDDGNLADGNEAKAKAPIPGTKNGTLDQRVVSSPEMAAEVREKTEEWVNQKADWLMQADTHAELNARWEKLEQSDAFKRLGKRFADLASVLITTKTHHETNLYGKVA